MSETQAKRTSRTSVNNNGCMHPGAVTGAKSNTISIIGRQNTEAHIKPTVRDFALPQSIAV